MQSVTEESDLNEFLSTAKLAGTEFTAGKYIVLHVISYHPHGIELNY